MKINWAGGDVKNVFFSYVLNASGIILKQKWKVSFFNKGPASDRFLSLLAPTTQWEHFFYVAF